MKKVLYGCLVIFLFSTGFNCSVDCDNCDLLSNVLQSEKLSKYLHPELKERQTLYLVENSFCNLNKKIGVIQLITLPKDEAVKHKNYIKLQALPSKGKQKKK